MVGSVTEAVNPEFAGCGTREHAGPGGHGDRGVDAAHRAQTAFVLRRASVGMSAECRSKSSCGETPSRSMMATRRGVLTIVIVLLSSEWVRSGCVVGCSPDARW